MNSQTKPLLQQIDPGLPAASGVAQGLLTTEGLVKEYGRRRVVNAI